MKKHLNILLFFLLSLSGYGQTLDPTIRIDNNLRAAGLKGLSERDFTTEDSLKLVNMAEGSGTVSTTTITAIGDSRYKSNSYVPSWTELTGKPTIPTALSGFSNDLGLQTASQVNTAITTATSPLSTSLALKANLSSVPTLSQFNILSANVTNPANLTQTGSYRLVTDQQIAAWDAKATTSSSVSGVAANAVGNAQVLNYSITPEKTTFFQYGKNLFDKSKVTSGFYIDNNGTLNASAGNNVSGMVPLDPNSIYTVSSGGTGTTPGTENKQFFAIYDAAGQIIVSSLGLFNRATTQFQTTATTRFGRFTVPSSSLATFQVEKVATLSSPPTTYEGYKIISAYETPNSQVAYNTALSAQAALNQVVTLGKNLYNNADPKNERGSYITNTGSKVTDVNFTTSAPIRIVGGSPYVVNSSQFIAYLASDTVTVVGGENFNHGLTANPPSSAVFAKLSVPVNQTATFQFQQGTVLDETATARPALAANTILPNPLQGKRVLWLGTSIPKLSNYPVVACSMLGATGINNAVSSSAARKGKSNGSIAGLSYPGTAWALSATLAEKNAYINNFQTIKDSLNMGFGGPSSLTLSQADRDVILGTSYENLLMPYLTGASKVDAVIFNHDFNDKYDTGQTAAQFSSVPTNPYDRNTYVGAINYLIREIQKVDPTMRIGIISHYESQRDPELVKADSVIAVYNQLPLLRLDQKTGWSQRVIPGTASKWGSNGYSGSRGIDAPGQDMTVQRIAVPDGVHPSSDTTGKSPNLLARLCAIFLSGLL